jgi:hypothetical protein
MIQPQVHATAAAAAGRHAVVPSHGSCAVLPLSTWRVAPEGRQAPGPVPTTAGYGCGCSRGYDVADIARQVGCDGDMLPPACAHKPARGTQAPGVVGGGAAAGCSTTGAVNGWCVHNLANCCSLIAGAIAGLLCDQQAMDTRGQTCQRVLGLFGCLHRRLERCYSQSRR